MEKGTLYQIRNLIDRRNITKHPKSDVNAAEDFLEVVIISHILTAVMTYLGMNSLNEMPSTEFLSQDIWMSDDKERRELLTKISTDIVNNFVDLSPSFSSTFQKDEGTAYDYACEVLSLGLFSLILRMQYEKEMVIVSSSIGSTCCFCLKLQDAQITQSKL